MVANLTGSKIKDTYNQVLHVDGGPTSAEKAVTSGLGVATALKLGTVSASIGNIRFQGNALTAVSGFVDMSNVRITSGSVSGIDDLAIADGGTGASTATDARVNLGLGSMAIQNANAVNILGGSITGVSFSGTFSGITSISSDSFSTFNIANALNIEANNISAVGSGVDVGINLVPQGAGTVNIGNLSASGNTVVSTNTNGNINLTPNGTGSVVVSKIDVQAGSVPFGVITNKAYGQFYSTQDQSTTANTPVAATFNTSDAFNTNITLASGSHIVFADPGVYRVTTSIQFANSNTSDHIATFWFRQNGADLANSASVTNIPKAADGGLTMVEITVLVSIAATNDYLELWWAPDHAAVTIDYSAAQTSPYTRPAIPSVILVAERAE